MRKELHFIFFFILLGALLCILLYNVIHSYTNTRIETGRIPNKSEFWKEYYYVNHTDSFMNGSTLNIYQYDSLLGWRIVPNYYTNTFCNDKTFTSDSLGIRKNGHQSIASKKTILFIGDSFVEGSEVSDQNTLPALIEQLDTNYTVINAGVGGYGFDQIYVYMQELIPQISPDVVVLGFVNTDIDRVNLSFRDYYKPYFTLDSDSLILHNKHIEDVQSLQNNFSSPNRVCLFFELLQNHNIREKDMNLSAKITQAMEAYASNNHFPFYIYYIPTPMDLLDREDYFNQGEIFEEVTAAIDSNSIFSPLQYIYQQKDLLPKREGHWDSTGNYFLAQFFVDSVLPNIPMK